MEEKEILHYIRNDNGLLFLVIIGVHCPDSKTASSILSECRQITESEFDDYYKALSLEIITVGDTADVNELVAYVVDSDNIDPKA